MYTINNTAFVYVATIKNNKNKTRLAAVESAVSGAHTKKYNKNINRKVPPSVKCFILDLKAHIPRERVLVYLAKLR